MPMAAASSIERSSPAPSEEVLELARLERVLPPLLSVIAGTVDVIGFLSLGLFTAHVTGNLVAIAALVVRGGPPHLAQVLAVPVFIVAVAAVWLIGKATDRRGPALVRPLLLVHFVLLGCVLIFSVTQDPAAKPHGLIAGIAAMIAVAAMACQFALLRLAVPGAPSTAVMTGNLTNAVLSLLDTLSGSHPLTEGGTKHATDRKAIVPRRSAQHRGSHDWMDTSGSWRVGSTLESLPPRRNHRHHMVRRKGQRFCGMVR